jgi:hypothetical protein
MPKIAVCYWGMTRSTKQVYTTHNTNIFNVLIHNNIEYDVYMHTWETEKNANIIWENDCKIDVDYEEYKLLNPTFYKIDKQNDFLNTIKFEDYYYEGEFEWRPQLIINHLCALESQKRVYNMVIERGVTYDYIMFIRPDTYVFNALNAKLFGNDLDFDIIIPNTDHNEGLNDRFAILPFHKALPYATRIDEIIEFRKHNGRIVSEKYVKFIVNKYYKTLVLCDLFMKIIRPNGEVAP